MIRMKSRNTGRAFPSARDFWILRICFTQDVYDDCNAS
jgi:hypothetical protein